jgi:hypothetical protein
VFQDSGGAVAIALSLKKVAKLLIPAVPRNLRSWGGSRLFPRLLVALYLCYNTSYNSYVVINAVLGSLRGLYRSIGIVSL